MMSLGAFEHLWNARVDPRRRTYAAGLYTHVLDRYGIATAGGAAARGCSARPPR
jgi:hypothetical protein